MYPQNARRILANLGKDIDIVAGVFDEAFLRSRKCDALEISREPLRCALSASHPLADRPRLSLADLSLQNLMLMQRGWNGDVDAFATSRGRSIPRSPLKTLPSTTSRSSTVAKQATSSS